MFKRFPFLSRSVVFVLAPLMLILSLLYFVGTKSLPIYGDELEIEGLNARINIAYDNWGVPTISAEADDDAFFAIGFLHAQNRLWQMEVNRRRASGTLSEILGESTLRHDVLMRTFGLKRNAERVLAGLSLTDLNVLNAYVTGVNEGIKKLERLPPEYTLLNFEPKPWTVLDSLMWLELINFQLSSGLASELQNALIIRSFDTTVVSELIADTLSAKREEHEHFKDINVEKIYSGISSDYLNPKPAVGSNAWAISGKYTKSGRPLLANDPHLENSLPSIFYLANIKGNKLDVSGATFPGTPFVVSGFNRNIAWGVTSMIADTQDVYVERANPLNPNQYELDGKYVDLEIYTESIQIKSDPLKAQKPNLQLTVRQTHRGPVLSDLYPDIGGMFSLRWTAYDDNGGTFKSFLKINYANNWEDFNESLNEYVGPILKFVYADKDGNIGSIAPGKYPIRPALKGQLPAPGWLSENDWKGWIPRSEWPHELNPENGIVVAANHNSLTESFPYYVSDDWAPNYRFDRISEMLTKYIADTEGKLSIRELTAIQTDVKHPLVSQIHRYIKTMNKELLSPIEIDALKLVAEWDGAMDSDSAEAAIVTSWMANLTEIIFEDDIKRSNLQRGLFEGLLGFENPELMEKVLEGEAPSLCRYSYKDTFRSCNEVVALALGLALSELRDRLGKDTDEWRMGQLTTTDFVHFPFSAPRYTGLNENRENKVLSYFFHRKLLGSGTTESINVKSASLNRSTKYHQLFGSAYRQLIDLGSLEESVFMLSTGQSGNIFSDHYADMMKLFDSRLYIQMQNSTSQKEFSLVPRPVKNGN